MISLFLLRIPGPFLLNKCFNFLNNSSSIQSIARLCLAVSLFVSRRSSVLFVSVLFNIWKALCLSIACPFLFSCAISSGNLNWLSMNHQMFILYFWTCCLRVRILSLKAAPQLLLVIFYHKAFKNQITVNCIWSFWPLGASIYPFVFTALNKYPSHISLKK